MVRRLKAAGAIVLAKTNTPEFAAGANTVNALFGATRNPWNPALSPAGSSGGSAVAVATGMVPARTRDRFRRLDPDTRGVLRHRGHTSDARTDAELPDAARLGPRASARPAGAHRGGRGAHARRDGRIQPALADFGGAAVDERAGRGRALQRCRADCGSPMRRTSPGSGSMPRSMPSAGTPRTRCAGRAPRSKTIAFDVSDGRDPYQTWRGAWMVGQQFARLAQLEQFGANLKGNVKAGLKVTALDLATAEHTRQRLFHRFRELFERYDVLLTPAAPVKPYPIEMNFPNEINGRKFENYVDWIAPAFLITLMSLPAGSVPAGKTRDGLPVGLQVVAPRFEEPRILSVAKLMQQAHPIGWPPYS